LIRTLKHECTLAAKVVVRNERLDLVDSACQAR